MVYDCKDDSDLVNPSIEVDLCDDGEILDNDCDGQTDEDVEVFPTWYVDDDSDGYGSDTNFFVGCAAPDDGSVYIDVGDCNDADAAVTRILFGILMQTVMDTEETLSRWSLVSSRLILSQRQMIATMIR